MHLQTNYIRNIYATFEIVQIITIKLKPTIILCMLGYIRDEVDYTFDLPNLRAWLREWLFFGKPFQLGRLVVEYCDRNKCDRQRRAQVFMCVIDLNGYCVFQIVWKCKIVFHTFDIYNRSVEGCKQKCILKLQKSKRKRFWLIHFYYCLSKVDYYNHDNVFI